MSSSRRSASALFLAVVAFALLLAAWGASTSRGGTSPATRSGNVLGLINPDWLTVGSDTTYPPMEFADTKHPGRFIGADIDLANALAKKMGLKGARFVSAGFDTLIASLAAHRFDVVISAMNDTAERRKIIDYVDYMRAAQGILVKASNKITANTYNALCGMSIAAQAGTTETEGLDTANKTCSKKIHVQRYTRDTDAYQAFAAGHVDAYTTDWPVVIHYYKTNPDKYRIAGKPILLTNYGIGVSKQSHALKLALQKALSAIMADGEYAKILKKWGLANTALKKP